MDRSFDYHFVLSFFFKSPEFETRILSKWFFHFLYERKSFENVRNVNLAPPILKFFRLMTLKKFNLPPKFRNQQLRRSVQFTKWKSNIVLYPGSGRVGWWCGGVCVGLVLKFRRPACPKFQHVETRGKIVEKCTRLWFHGRI